MALLLRPIAANEVDLDGVAAEPVYAPLLRFGIAPFLLIGDLAACLTAGLVASSPWYDIALMITVVISGLALKGLYRSKLSLSVLDDLPTIVLCWLVGVAAVMAYHHLVLEWLGGFRMVIAAAGLLVLSRVVNYSAVRLLRQRGLVAYRTLIVGHDTIAQELAERLSTDREYGLVPIGYVDSADETESLASSTEFSQVLARRNPQVLIISRGAVSELELVDLVRSCHRHRCEVFVIPRLQEVQHQTLDTEFVWGIPLMRLRRAAYRTGTWRLKRLVDVAVAGIGLVVLAPVLLVCAVAVRLEGGPGVIFRQERIGVDGRRFQLMKFRSMKPADPRESQVQWNIAGDARVGRVGRLLRKTSLDELPQLINIVRGEMSIVGPRPERPHFVEEFGRLYTGYAARHRVPCGLTGWAQIHGLRGDTPIADRARFDNWYIENWSLWLDSKIILRTVTSIFRSPGS